LEILKKNAYAFNFVYCSGMCNEFVCMYGHVFSSIFRNICDNAYVCIRGMFNEYMKHDYAGIDDVLNFKI
jgi:hypothetical protein